MRFKACIVLAATIVSPLLSANAASIGNQMPPSPQPSGVSKAGDRSFGGGVQSITPAGKIRLRDGKYGDVTIVITSGTKISKKGQPATASAITVGTRCHGQGSFRGGYYFAKIITID